MYYLGFTYEGAYMLPVWKRKWFIERVVKEITKSNTSKPDSNDPMNAALMGKQRLGNSPARLRRFT